MPLLAFSNRNSFVVDLAVVFRYVLMLCHMILHLDHIEKSFCTLPAYMASSVVVIVHMLVNLGEIGKRFVTSVTCI